MRLIAAPAFADDTADKDAKEPTVMATPIKPPPGKTYDDFQLSMALAFLHKTLAAQGAGQPDHA